MTERPMDDYLDAAEDLEEPANQPDLNTWEGEGGAVDMDPFGEANVKQVSLIVHMRIYDALMALLETQDEIKATELHKLHKEGGIMYSLPIIDLTGY